MDEYTPDAWHDLLAWLPLDEARAAVIAVASRQPFVAPAEIIAEVRQARRPARDAEQVRTLTDPAAYRASIAQADSAFLRKLAARTGRDRVTVRAITEAEDRFG